jgi:hypothetical protein
LPHWLSCPRFAAVPLFVARQRLASRRRLPRACGCWALDSGGFTELSLHHGWTISVVQYVEEVRRIRDEVGGLAWAAPMDWMCEPAILAGTGLSVGEHQERTVANLLELRSRAPELPFIPVLQGWEVHDYLRCVELYERAGVDLRAEPTVGVGSVCRRQDASEGAAIMRSLAELGLRLHGFGFKVHGLRACADAMVSADSLAWSYAARYHPPLPGHDRPGPGRRVGHGSCANCPDYALSWRLDVLRSAGGPRQGNLFYATKGLW